MPACPVDSGKSAERTNHFRKMDPTTPPQADDGKMTRRDLARYHRERKRHRVAEGSRLPYQLTLLILGLGGFFLCLKSESAAAFYERFGQTAAWLLASLFIVLLGLMVVWLPQEIVRGIRNLFKKEN